ncbi:AtpZ/AtpI family protein [Aquimarina sp. MMG016]|uniref:AtpZ/AtpI family protein n=1 Tax=Aquimarina sp. MMG016 TaxID=2822690 RepID=UPI001B3A4A54|nr:AtpZ/AtpI family protein [Aquimarina sp. MMG016]MBQ4820067.1 hypothetical protein [Aquimarina sp. MMG016]
MSQLDQNDEEVYLKQVFGPIREFFKSVLRLFYLSILFLRKKAFLFIGLVVVGVILGYFLDRHFETNTIKQEITIEPRHNSTSYLYNFVDNLSSIHNSEEYFQSLGLRSEWIENIKSIKIKPIVAIEDIFDHLHTNYEDYQFQYTIRDYSEKEIESNKYTFFYRYHKLTISFIAEKEYNKRITDTFLQYIYSNEHFKKQTDLSVNQARESLEKNKTSLQFIDQYLSKLTKEKTDDTLDVVIVADDSQTSTVASLLKEKAAIVKSINKSEKVINLHNEFFSVIEKTNIIIEKKKLYYRMIALVPLTLCFSILFFYISIFLYRSMENFITKVK